MPDKRIKGILKKVEVLGAGLTIPVLQGLETAPNDR